MTKVLKTSWYGFVPCHTIYSFRPHWGHIETFKKNVLTVALLVGNPQPLFALQNLWLFRYILSYHFVVHSTESNFFSQDKNYTDIFLKRERVSTQHDMKKKKWKKSNSSLITQTVEHIECGIKWNENRLHVVKSVNCNY